MSHAPHQSRFFSRRIILGATLGSALIFFFAGIIFWGGFNTAMEVTNTMDFCISCHEMEANVYQEYKPTIHYSNRTGVRATCPDCHVPDPWVHKVVRKIQASRELLSKALGTVDTPEKFDNHRLVMAKRVWTAMKTTDSRECRNCHNYESMNPEQQRPRARKQHMNAFETGRTCIDCHKGIAHKNVRDLLSDEELETLEAPNPHYARKVPAAYLAGLERIEAKEAEEKAQLAQAKQQQREQLKAAKLAQQQRTEAAVTKARTEMLAQQSALQSELESLKAMAKTSAATTTASAATVVAAASAATAATSATVPASASSSDGFGIDWSGVAEREVTLLYPGEASMEWVLVGKYHGGARPFRAGDRCVDCHEQEIVDMGKKIVSGEKIESQPIAGKRGSIPVSVQAAHDSEYLFLRFQWKHAEHVPVPFVEGGKMDPENQIKLAFMLATDEVKYTSQAGCWATCHHDLKTMPNHPEDPGAAGLDLDFSKGVTKYISASRTKIEEKGRRGKKLGGWDKLTDSSALKAAMNDGHFMDLLRYSSSGKTEDGHVLEQRIMTGGQGAQSQGTLEDGLWTVVMKRKLVSDKPGDVSIEAGKLYNFGFAIHDDHSNARFHHVSLGYKLGLDSAEAEINAVKQ